MINQNLLLAGDDQYQISRSLRFNSADSAYLNRTFGTPTNALKWTLSTWVKISSVPTYNPLFAGGTSGSAYAALWFNNGALVLFSYNGSTVYHLQTTAVYRDPSAWYHIQVAFDSSQATSSDRIKIYINGVQVTAFSTATYPSLNLSGYINSSIAHYIGQFTPAGVGYFNGYLTEVNFIDGQALTPSSFGETDPQTGVWRPKKYTGTYGTNGFILTFEDNSGTTSTTLGKDSSGNGNNWTPNNFSVTAGAGNDSLVDVPTRWGSNTGAGGEVRGNYATLNPIDRVTTATLSNGNLDFATATTGHNAIATIGMTTGKWYWEAVTTAGTTEARGGVYGTSASSLYSFAANNTAYGFRFDADTGALDYTTNGSSWVSLATGLTSGPYFPYLNNNGTTSKTITVNFGQRPFAYTAPSGFKALCTTSLPTPTIGSSSSTLANKYFDATTYTGTSADQTVTNSGSFQPDLVWIKSRSAITDNYLFDAIRGTANLISNSTNAENNFGTFLGYTSSGFTVSNAGGARTGTNTNGATYVAWQWNAGGSTVTNTAGTITSSVRANTTAGFSIVTYTGTGANATVGHGLGVAPAMMIIKNRSNGTPDWAVYHKDIGNAKYLLLNTTGAAATSINFWNNTSPTSSVFTVGIGGSVNNNTENYVAYLFTDVAGFSKFGSYTGNGSTDGPFVYLGFRPRYLLWKRTDTTGSWWVSDSSRQPSNASNLFLYPDLSNAESSDANGGVDLLSNGFKLRNSGSASANASGGTYIYAAFAEFPTKYALAR